MQKACFMKFTFPIITPSITRTSCVKKYKKEGIRMWEKIMEAGKGIYFLWGIGLLGLLLKMITNTYLKSMIKASENMATTKKKSLRIMRQKYENGCYNP